MKNSELAEIAIVIPKSVTTTAINSLVYSAINEMKGEFLSVKDIARLAGIGETTLWYRVKTMWKLTPKIAKCHRGQEVHLFNRAELMQRLQASAPGRKS
jgi:hypothetical protein